MVWLKDQISNLKENGDYRFKATSLWAVGPVTNNANTICARGENKMEQVSIQSGLARYGDARPHDSSTSDACATGS